MMNQLEKENVIEYGGFVELNDAPNIENIDTFFEDTCKEVGAIVSKNIELTMSIMNDIMNDILKVTKRKRLAKKIAIKLVEEGYRKQVQGEWVKVFDCALHIEDTKTGKTEFYNRYVCSNCGKITNEKSVENCENYCSHCGAKMKGN